MTSEQIKNLGEWQAEWMRNHIPKPDELHMRVIEAFWQNFERSNADAMRAAWESRGGWFERGCHEPYEPLR